MKHANLLHWTLVFLWPGWRGSFAWYRWGILRGQHGGKAYLGPLEIIWGPRCPDTPPLCDGCHEPTLSLTRIDRTGGPDGEFCDGCVEMINEPECTCYELTGGHMPGCYFNHRRPCSKCGGRLVDEGFGGAPVQHHNAGCPEGPWTQFMRGQQRG